MLRSTEYVTQEQAHRAEGGRVLAWEYDAPGHALSAEAAWALATRIRQRFLAARAAGADAAHARAQLLAQDASAAHFARPDCFARLFQLLCDDSTTEADLEVVERMVRVRARVLAGALDEAQAAQEVLRLVVERRTA